MTVTVPKIKTMTQVNRSFSILNVKAVDEEKRVISGVATTPEPDRLGDIIEPLGVQFKNPMPLLWQHKSSEPVGQVRFDKPTKDGITFEAKIVKAVEPGRLKDRVDEAWQSIKLGLVRAVSIGFRAIEMNFMDDGGIRFIKTEVLELSLVTIPANQEATITSIKAYDDVHRLGKSSGIRLVDYDQEIGPPLVVGHSRNMVKLGPVPGDENPLAASGRPNLPGVTGQPVQAKEATPVKRTIQEQIAQFEQLRATKSADMDAIMEAAGDSTLAPDQAEKYDTLQAEIKEINEHLVRLRAREDMVRQMAQPVQGDRTPSQQNLPAVIQRSAVPAMGSNSQPMGIEPMPMTRVQILPTQLPKGTAFTRYVLCMVRAKGNRSEAREYAKEYRDTTPEVELALSTDVVTHMKAAIGAGTTTDVAWASPLIAYQVMASEFAELLRPATIIGRIPGLRRVPFNIQLPRALTGTSVGWVGEGAPKPVGRMTFDTLTLRWAKAAGIVVLTDELVRFSNPSAEAIIRQDLIDAMAQFLDRDFIDPAKAEVLNVSPASITNGVAPIVASGTTAAAFRTDMRKLFNTFFLANVQPGGGVFIMTQQLGLSMSLMLNSLGQQFFPSISADGGTLLGYPVITSENIPATGGSPADGYPLIFLKASEIMLADDGQTIIDASREASVQMDTAPDSPPTAATTMVSLWQLNMTGLRAERWINWKKRRPQAVAWISNAKYAE